MGSRVKEEVRSAAALWASAPVRKTVGVEPDQRDPLLLGQSQTQRSARGQAVVTQVRKDGQEDRKWLQADADPGPTPTSFLLSWRPHSITVQKRKNTVLAEQSGFSGSRTHAVSARGATVTANSQRCLLTNSSPVLTFRPPSEKVISPSLLSGAWGPAGPP